MMNEYATVVLSGFVLTNTAGFEATEMLAVSYRGWAGIIRHQLNLSSEKGFAIDGLWGQINIKIPLNPAILSCNQTSRSYHLTRSCHYG
jgi:hypothetical protein